MKLSPFNRRALIKEVMRGKDFMPLRAIGARIVGVDITTIASDLHAMEREQQAEHDYERHAGAKLIRWRLTDKA